MKAHFQTTSDGTVTVCIEAEDPLETQLLTVFYAQTYRAKQPTAVLHLGPRHAQLMAADRYATFHKTTEDGQ